MSTRKLDAPSWSSLLFSVCWHPSPHAAAHSISGAGLLLGVHYLLRPRRRRRWQLYLACERPRHLSIGEAEATGVCTMPGSAKLQMKLKPEFKLVDFIVVLFKV